MDIANGQIIKRVANGDISSCRDFVIEPGERTERSLIYHVLPVSGEEVADIIMLDGFRIGNKIDAPLLTNRFYVQHLLDN